MKTPSFSLAIAFVLLAVFVFPARVQAQAENGAGGGGRMAFLSADDRAHLLKVRQEVMATHPDLKAEQESLMKEREYVKNKGADASDEDRKTLRENFMAHSEKMEAAMKETDPTIAPVLEQINAKMKERYQQHADQAGGGDNAPAN